MHKIGRREFMAHAAGAFVGLGTARLWAWRFPAPPIAPQRSWPKVVVSAGTNDDSPAALLKAAIDELGGIGRFVRPGHTVAIKPNAAWAYPPGTASSTDPGLLGALILMVREAGARRIIVTDHCAIDPGTEACLSVSGIGEVVDRLFVEKVFPDRAFAPKEVFTTIDLPMGRAFQRIGVIRAAAAADVRINLAVAKSHVGTRCTMCLKNMMGFLESPSRLHDSLEQGIADINSPSRIQAQLHILEAIRVRLPIGRSRAGGTETETTHPEKIKRLNQIVAGTDPVLIDGFGSLNYFSIKPRELAFIKKASDDKLGEHDAAAALLEGRLRVVLPIRAQLKGPSSKNQETRGC